MKSFNLSKRGEDDFNWGRLELTSLGGRKHEAPTRYQEADVLGGTGTS